MIPPEFEHDQFDISGHMGFLEKCASRAGTILEIGVGHGNGSTRAFARGLKRSEPIDGIKFHLGVDCDKDRPQCGGPDVMVYGRSESLETLSRVEDIWDKAAGGKINAFADIIFIDTDHTFVQLSREIKVWTWFADPGTLWIFHDTWMNGERNRMTDAILEWVEANPEWEFIDYSREWNGLGLMRWRGGTKWADL